MFLVKVSSNINVCISLRCGVIVSSLLYFALTLNKSHIHMHVDTFMAFLFFDYFQTHKVLPSYMTFLIKPFSP